MVIAHIFIGTFIGMMSFVVAMVQGASFWTGLGAYCVVGAGTTILMGTVQYLLTRGKAETASHTVEVVTAPPAPVAEVAPPPPVQPETVAETMEETGDEAVRSMKVLAVDDDPFILELVPKIAAMVGCEDITVAHSGPEALEIIANAEEPFDCLLLDINMPEMDGIELCARVRKLEDYQDTSIIMLTAMSDLDHLDRAFRAGASDYTTKPFDIIEFGDRLKTAQSRSSDNWTRAHEAEAAQAEGEGVDDWGSARLARLASVPAIIGYSALQNYLTRLSGPALEEAFVMAISVDRAAGPSDDADSAVPLRSLIMVARAIDDVFRNSKYMMAYAGHGQFVIVSSGQSLPRAAGIEGAIQERMSRKSGMGRPDASVSVGTAVRPGAGRMRRARVAFENALNLAGVRAAGKRGEHQWKLKQKLGF